MTTDLPVDFSDPVLILSAVAALCLIIALGALAFAVMGRRKDDAPDVTADLLNQLAGRIGQMAESQSAAQDRMSERLSHQERLIVKAVDDRLGEVTRRVGEGVTKNTEKTAEKLSELQARLAVIDEAQKNIAQLGADMLGLQDILSNKQTRGAIGQTQMEDLVRNMLPSTAYGFQVGLSNGKRVDCQIKLPNPPGSISVDSKYPLDAFMRIQNASDDQQRLQARREFQRDVITHIRDIAEKYIIPGETADTAIMFLPAESVFAELHDSFPDVITEGFRRRVFIVSPTTMMATLNTIRAILKDAKMREQAGIIQKEIDVMMKDVARLDDRVAKLANHFNQVTKDIGEIQTSTGKIIKRGTKIVELELESSDQDSGEHTDSAERSSKVVMLDLDAPEGEAHIK